MTDLNNSNKIVDDTSRYERIKKIAKQINKIKEKHILIDLINIIKTMNPELSITENDNGMFLKFNLLIPETYNKIENYLKKNLPKKSDELDSITTSEYVPYSPDDIVASGEKYKLSNKERTLIKKHKYSQFSS
jgi:hypothetical protein